MNYAARVMTQDVPDDGARQLPIYAGTGAESLDIAPIADREIVDRARALAPLIREFAQAGESRRALAPEIVQGLRDADLFRVVMPKRLGGLGSNMRTFLDVLMELGRADGAAAWAVGLLGAGNWFASLYSEACQAEVFTDNPEVAICGVFQTPKNYKGERVEIDGVTGIRVSGDFPWASGSANANWTTLGLDLGTEPGGPPNVGLGLVPISEVTIKESWFTAGMRATSSNTLVVRDVFIPDYRIQPFGNFVTGNYDRAASREPLDYAAFFGLSEIALTGMHVGMARAVIEHTIERSATKSVAYTIFPQVSESPAHQMELANAACEVDQAYLLLARAAADIDIWSARFEQPDILTRARIRMDAGQASKLCRGAINRLMSVNGASSFADVSVLQRYWRDSEMASRHALVLAEIAVHIYGCALFGSEDLPQAV